MPELISGLIGLIIVGIFLYLIGRTGQCLKNGLEERYELNRKIEITKAQGRKIDQSKVKKYRRTVNKNLGIAVFGLSVMLIGYISILLFVPGLFLFSLLALIPLVLGYFDIFLIPGG